MKPIAMMSVEELEMELDILQKRMMEANDPNEIEALDEKITEIEDILNDSTDLDNY